MFALRRFVVLAVLAPCVLAAALAVTLASAGPPPAPSSGHPTVDPERPVRMLPTISRFRPSPIGAARSIKPMEYHGGPVMTGPIKVYVIWYGNWSRKTRRRAIITDFLNNLAGPRFAINMTYPDASGATVANSLTLAGQHFDRYSAGRTSVTDAKIGRIVASAIRLAKLPSDPNGIYLVLTSNDVGKPGFLTQYCGWHSFRRIGAHSIKYAFVGDPTGPNLLVCGAQKVSPNADAGADAMVSVIAHEIDEAVTDPELNAWYDSTGAENADRCSWSYGPTFPVGRAKANLRLGTRNFLIQRNWLNTARGGCVLEVPLP